MPHTVIMLKKAKIASLRRIKPLVTSDVMISLYKAYVLLQLGYCCPLLLGIFKALKNNIERTNRYPIKTLLNLCISATNDFCLAMATMNTLKQRRILQSLILFLNVLN